MRRGAIDGTGPQSGSAWGRSGPFLWVIGLGLLLFALTSAHALWSSRAAAPLIAKRAALVAVLDLTDLALFTEARYTRHPSQADLHTAFQDHPMALDRFPSGSLVPAPVCGLDSRVCD